MSPEVSKSLRLVAGPMQKRGPFKDESVSKVSKESKLSSRSNAEEGLV